MLIVCPSCATSYNLALETLGATGRSVRCARCGGIWHAEAPRETKLLAAVEAQPEPTSAWQSHGSRGGVEAENVTLYGDNPASSPDQPDEWAFQVDQGAPHAPETPAPQEFGQRGLELDQAHGSLHQADSPSIAPIDFDQPLSIFDEPPGHAEAGQGDDAAAVQDVGSLAAPRRRSAARKIIHWHWQGRPSRLQSAILALAILDFMLVGLRSDVVRFLPQTASLYAMIGLPVNLRGLAFNEIVTTKEQHDGMPVLVVEGNIVNVARKPVEVPRLKFAVRSAVGNEIYSWTMVPSRTVLPAGETVAFHSRLASPPPEGRDVLVRFFTRRDIVAGIR